MSIPKYNPHILRRTPTAVDIDDKDKFLKFINSPIYLVLQDKQEIYGALDSIEEDKKVISVASDIPPVCYTLENTRPIPVCGRVYRVPVNAIAITYFGPAADLRLAKRQWENNRNTAPYSLRINVETVKEAYPHEIKMEHVNEVIFPETALERMMTSISRYLDGEFATVDQALGLVHATAGPPKKSRKQDLDYLCWRAFVLQKLIAPPLPLSRIAIKVKGVQDTPSFRRDCEARIDAMQAKALRFAIQNKKVVFPLPNPSELPSRSKERKAAEELLKNLEEFV